MRKALRLRNNRDLSGELLMKKKGIHGNQGVWLIWVTFTVALFISLFISAFPIKDGGYATQRFMLCLVSILFSCVGVVRYSRAVRLNSSSVLELIVLLASISAFVVTPLFYSDRFKWVEPAMFAFFFSAVILGSHQCVRQGSVISAVSGMSVVTVVLSLFYGGMTLNYYIFSVLDRDFNIDNLIPWGFINMRYWSHMSTWLLPLFPLALITFPFRTFTSWKLLVYFAGSLWVWLMIMSTARGSFVGLLVGVCVAMVLFGKGAWPWLRTYFYLWSAGLLAWLVLSIALPSLIFGQLEIRNVSSGDSGRLPLWGEALSMSMERFPWGMGPQSWLTHDIITSAYQGSRKYGHPHNMYLMWAAEYGWASILGLAVLGLVGARRLVLLRKFLRGSHNDHAKSVIVALTVSVVAALFHSGVSAVLMAPASMLVGLFILMAFWGALQHREQWEVSWAVGNWAQVACVIALLTVITLSALWLREVQRYHTAMVKDQDYYFEYVPLGLLPRFWHHGNFPRNPGPMP